MVQEDRLDFRVNDFDGISLPLEHRLTTCLKAEYSNFSTRMYIEQSAHLDQHVSTWLKGRTCFKIAARLLKTTSSCLSHV